MKRKVALITGITGQDGSYLAEFLLEKGYEVHGIMRRASTFPTERVDHLIGKENFFIHYGDLLDAASLRLILEKVKPDEVYNLGAMSHVRVSFDIPTFTADTVYLGTLRLLEAIRDYNKDIKFYQASSSEMFGKVVETPQTEKTPFYPRSPYAVAKAAAHWQVINYRESYGMFACNGILFNHFSPRRGETFVSRKITRAATRIKLGLQDKLYLGNIDSQRDFGWAPDYVEAMWLMLQQDKPDDYVIATGEAHSVRELLTIAFEAVGLEWEKYVDIDERLYRPAEVDFLLGDASKAKKVLGWEPKMQFKESILKMVESDMRIAEKEKMAKDLEKLRENIAVAEKLLVQG